MDAKQSVVAHLDSMHDAYNTLDDVAHMLNRKLEHANTERMRLMEECADLRVRLARVTKLQVIK